LQSVAQSNERNRWAIITPSYHGDFARCKLLCQSMDAFVTGPWHHYIIVETVDLELFKPLQGPHRTILEMEAILPKWIYHLTRFKIINNRSVWFSFRTGFMIGWQIQQLVKLEMAFQLQEEGLLYCDSDVFFIRPFEISELSSNGKFRYFRSANLLSREFAPHPIYMVTSAKQLGLGKDPFPSRSYVNNLVTWHAPTVRALCAHVENQSGRDWKVTLGRSYTLSEYTLYGLFADRILEDSSHLAPTSTELCRTIWRGKDLPTIQLKDLLSAVPLPQVAVGFQSFIGVSIDELSAQLERAIEHHDTRNTV
jgi:hypothetical protein